MWIVAGLCLVAFGALVLRLFHSVDVTDESFYAATAYRFALGGRPLIDDWSAQQIAFLVVSPLVRLHLALVGDTTGLMLTMRFTWLAMMCGAGATMWAALRRVVRPWTAFLAVAATIPLVPFAIMSPSYNTMALAGIMVGVAGGLAVLTRERALVWSAVAGFGFAFAAAAYPTLAIAGVVALVWLCWHHRERIGPFLLGALIIALPLAIVLIPNAQGIRASLAYIAALGHYGGTLSKLVMVAGGAVRFYARQPSFYFTVGCALWLVWRRRSLPDWVPLAACLLALVVVYTGPGYKEPMAGALMLTAALTWLPWRPRLGTDAARDRALRWSVLIGLVAGGLAAYSSTNGFELLMIGGIAVMPVLLALAGERFMSGSERTWLVPTALLIVMAAGLLFVWTVSYRDVVPLDQTARVGSGPFVGLYTTPSRAGMVQQLQSDLRAVVRPGDRLLVYDEMPGAYLMTSAMPDAPMLWTKPEEHDPVSWSAFERYIGQPDHVPTLAVRNDAYPASLYTDGLIDTYVRDHMKLVAVSDLFRVFTAR